MFSLVYNMVITIREIPEFINIMYPDLRKNDKKYTFRRWFIYCLDYVVYFAFLVHICVLVLLGFLLFTNLFRWCTLLQVRLQLGLLCSSLPLSVCLSVCLSLCLRRLHRTGICHCHQPPAIFICSSRTWWG